MDVPSAAATADRDLQSCREQVAAALEHVDQPVLLVDAEGVVVALNPVARRVLAGSAGDPVGRSFADLFPPARQDDVRRLQSELAAGGQVRLWETALVGRDGEVPVGLTARRIDEDGEIAGHVLTLRDLREGREIKRQLLRADRLATIGLLASSVAHEVGTPLSVILGRTELLGELIADNPAARRQCDAIASQIQRISDVVARLLTFSRESGTGAEPVYLNQVIQEVMQFVEPRLRQTDVKLELELQPSLPTLTGNPGHFYQVFLNLVMNAVDAMPDGGTLTLKTLACEGARFAPRLDLNCSCVQAYVVDSGTGIDPSQLKRIFEPFYTTKELSKGTGLGLAIADEIVRKYSGQLQVESSLGSGTRFLVNLPLAPRSLQVVR